MLPLSRVSLGEPILSPTGPTLSSLSNLQLIELASLQSFPSNSARNCSRDDATQHVDGEGVVSHSDGPRREAFRPSISATSQSLDGLDTLVDSGDELPSLTNLLSRARLVALRVAPQVINLTIDSSDDVT